MEEKDLISIREMYQSMMIDRNYTDISFQLTKFDESTFYYDETNNIRKLWLTEKGFNENPFADFILGGVMFFGSMPFFDIKELKKIFELQPNVPELKAKHILGKTDFLKSLERNQLFLFLQFLEKNNFYIHYSSVNNLYFTIVDIIDSIEYVKVLIEKTGDISLLNTLKNELYLIAIKNFNIFYDILFRYEMPNIPTTKIYDFYNKILKLIESECNLSFEQKLLREVIQIARNQKQAVLLENNPEYTILKNYSDFYLQKIVTFNKSQHIIDQEDKIVHIFEEEKVFDIIKNVKFENSKNDVMIQISDCVVGLLGSFHSYINRVKNEEEVLKTINSLNDYAKQTFYLFCNLILKSNRVSGLLFYCSQSIHTAYLQELALTQGLLFGKK